MKFNREGTRLIIQIESGDFPESNDLETKAEFCLRVIELFFKNCQRLITGNLSMSNIITRAVEMSREREGICK